MHMTFCTVQSVNYDAMYALAGFLVLFSDESSCLLRIAAKLCLREALSLGFLTQGPNYLCLTYFPLDLIGLKTQFGFLFFGMLLFGNSC